MEIGTPAVFGDMANPERTGWIASITPHENKVYTLGAGGMERERFALVIVWENRTFSEVSEGIAARWIERAADRGIESKTADEVQTMLEDAKAEQARQYAARTAELEAKQDEVSKWRDSIRDKIPTNAKAVIVAELKKDKSDSQTDYFGSTVTRTIILGFSTHTRDLFPEMRKAARNHEKTAFLADAPESAEHREKYSMGAGYYLKDGFRHSDGWKVSKQRFYNTGNDIAQNIPHGEWAVPAEQPKAARTYEKAEASTAEPVEIETPEGFTVSAHTHTKKGFQMYIVESAERVERETFMEWLNKAKTLRGWYTRKWGSTPAGFAFKEQAAAAKFLELVA